MNSVSLRKQLSEFERDTPPPNCVNEFLPHPKYGKSKCVEIGIVQEHRFAFCLWIKNKIEQMWLQKRTDKDFVPPDLVTWDWHNDFGADSDLNHEMLSACNVYNAGLWGCKTPSGREISGPPKGSYWKVSYEKFLSLCEDNRIWWGQKGDGIPRRKVFPAEGQSGMVPQKIWGHEEVGNTQEAKREVKACHGVCHSLQLRPVA